MANTPVVRTCASPMLTKANVTMILVTRIPAYISAWTGTTTLAVSYLSNLVAEGDQFTAFASVITAGGKFSFNLVSRCGMADTTLKIEQLS